MTARGASRGKAGARRYPLARRPGRPLNPKTARTVDLFAGPGGWEMGAMILGGRPILDRLRILGIEIEENAAATARRAGFHRRSGKTRGDVLRNDPRRYANATGLIASPVCPTFSKSGLRTGLRDDYQRALDVITHYGMTLDRRSGCTFDCADAERVALMGRVEDTRTALVVEAARWIFGMPRLEWVALEQVPGVEYLWEDLAAELLSAEWQYVDVVRFDAHHLGTVGRERAYLVARRYLPGSVSAHVWPDVVPRQSFAQLLGWPEGHQVNTRGQRKTSGGNVFSADGRGWCLTGSSRSWKRVTDGIELTAAEAGWLQGFPADYPWQGSRTSQFLHAADVVCPPAAAVILGSALGIDWQEPVRRWAAARADSFRPADLARAHAAGALFDLAG